jgi:endonuclease YncB( thermonuclease family)
LPQACHHRKSSSIDNTRVSPQAKVRPHGACPILTVTIEAIRKKWNALQFGAVLNLLGCNIAGRVAPIDGNSRVVERVIDGDTLVMENGERVRLIGVDTPETKHPTNPLSTSAKRLPFCRAGFPLLIAAVISSRTTSLIASIIRSD